MSLWRAEGLGLFDVGQGELPRGDYLISKHNNSPLGGHFMYLDTVVVVNIAVILAMSVGGGWMGVYAYKHIRQDAATQDKSDSSSETEKR